MEGCADGQKKSEEFADPGKKSMASLHLFIFFILENAFGKSRV